AFLSQKNMANNPSNPKKNTENNKASEPKNWILSAAMAAGIAGAAVAGKKLLEIALVNGMNGCDFIPFPLKSKTKKEEGC
ncbi:hypothetical protein A2U01_0088706, partial [Trifolium medium]|nr:hypothetical protein [Trifolium medium]